MSQTTALDHRTQKGSVIGKWLRAPAVTAQIRRLNPGADVERIFVLAMSQVKDNDKLMGCSPQSVVRAVATCATLGLEPDKVSQQAHLVPYAGVCTLIVGYKGLKKLAEQHPDVSHIEPPRIVYKKDHFVLRYGSKSVVEHHPELDDDPGPVRGCYVIAKLASGEEQVEWMNKRELDAVKAAATANKKRGDTPWNTHTEEMYRKTLVRRVCKHLPQSRFLAKAVTLDEQAEAGVSQDLDIIDMPGQEVEPNAKPRSLDEVVDRAEGRKRLTAEPAPPPTEAAPAPAPEDRQVPKGQKKEGEKPPAENTPGTQESLPLQPQPIRRDPAPVAPAAPVADDFVAKFKSLDADAQAELLIVYGIGTIQDYGSMNQKMQDDLRADVESSLAGGGA